MNIRAIFIATATVVLAGIAAQASPAFKQHATTAVLVLLGLIALFGLLVSLVLRHLDARPEMTGSEGPPGGLAAAAGIAHPGALR
jgi:hypothetical protein